MKTKATVLMIVALMLSIIVGAVSAQDGGGNRGRGRNQDGVRFEFMQDFADILTEATGLTSAEIREQVRDGATIAELITANGGSVDTVVAEIMVLAEERVAEAQENGNITEERATALRENIEEHITNFLNGEGRLLPNGGRPGGRDGGRNGNRPLVQAVAESTGLEAEDVITQVRDGASLSDILTANGVDTNTFIDEQSATYEERLTERVTEGYMSQEVADARLNLFRVQLNDWLNRTVEVDSD